MRESDATTPPKEKKSSRRRRLREGLALLRQRVQQACGLAQGADDLAARVGEVVEELRRLTASAEARELVPVRARRRLDEAAQWLAEIRERAAPVTDT